MQDRGGDPAGCRGVVLETNPIAAGEAPGKWQGSYWAVTSQLNTYP